MTDDSKAIVLLCGHLGNRDDADPLTASEYADLVHWLLANDLRPADLLAPEHLSPAAAGANLPEPRLSALLERGVQLGFTIERWTQSGLWVISRSDDDYPARLKTHLREKAPPILYGAGDRALLQGGGPGSGGLAIVGSRNVDEAGQEFARDVGAWCARGGMPVVSGCARGVDQIAMSAALEYTGTVIGILADNLLKKSVARDARQGLAAGNLLLISAYHPEARFTVGSAMGSNKLIYAMADYAVVVSSEHRKGGTWAGATEELKRKPARPVFVRTTGSPPPGNEKLLNLGALPFPDIDGDADPHTLLESVTADRPHPPTASQDLFDFVKTDPSSQAASSDAPDAEAAAE